MSAFYLSYSGVKIDKAYKKYTIYASIMVLHAVARLEYSIGYSKG